MAHTSNDPDKLHVVVVAIVFTFTIPALMAATLAVRPAPPVDPFAGAANRLGVSVEELHRGRSIFSRTCAVCHGADGNGVPRLGKPLRNSAFVQEHSDEELLALVVEGRLPTDPANTTGVAMPPRGAQALADDQIEDIVHYLRTLQEPGMPTASLHPWMTRPQVIAGAPSAPASQTSSDGPGDLNKDASGVTDTPPPASAAVSSATPSASPTGAASSAPPAGAAPSALPAGTASSVGHTKFVAACSACHGPDGAGIEKLGKPLTTSAFVKSKTDAELITFIKSGRPIWDAENTTGVDMPPKGGNPALTEEDINDIVGFIRALQEGS